MNIKLKAALYTLSIFLFFALIIALDKTYPDITLKYVLLPLGISVSIFTVYLVILLTISKN